MTSTNTHTIHTTDATKTTTAAATKLPLRVNRDTRIITLIKLTLLAKRNKPSQTQPTAFSPTIPTPTPTPPSPRSCSLAFPFLVFRFTFDEDNNIDEVEDSVASLFRPPQSSKAERVPPATLTYVLEREEKVGVDFGTTT